MAKFEYQVTGRHRFPVDMLRYDGAYPKTGADVEVLESVGDWTYKETSVRLMSDREPTYDRWSSFGWTVTYVAKEGKALPKFKNVLA
jgi:hypothetical protein